MKRISAAIFLYLIPFTPLLSQKLKLLNGDFLVESEQYFNDSINPSGEILEVIIFNPKREFHPIDSCVIEDIDHSYVEFVFWQRNDENFVLMQNHCDSLVKVDQRNIMKLWQKNRQVLQKEACRLDEPVHMLSSASYNNSVIVSYETDSTIDVFEVNPISFQMFLTPRLYFKTMKTKRRLRKLFFRRR